MSAVGLVLTGRGGQGVKLATELLAAACSWEGKVPVQYSVYGALIRGGDIASFLAVSETDPGLALRSSYDFMLALHNNWYDKYYALLAPGGTLVADAQQVPSSWLTRTDLTHHVVDFTAVAAEHGDIRAANMVAAGVMAAVSGVASLDGLGAGLTAVIPSHRADRIEDTVRAVRVGYELALDLSQNPMRDPA
jgi:2-oxoglutarate ferredoxin oxidoreductase subunit gamma